MKVRITVVFCDARLWRFTGRDRGVASPMAARETGIEGQRHRHSPSCMIGRVSITMWVGS